MSDRKLIIRFFNDVFPEPQRAEIYDYLSSPGWESGWKSNSKRDGYSFFHKHFAGRRKAGDAAYSCEDELLERSSIMFDAWTTVKAKLPHQKLVRCYANGMCYGQDGGVHTDANDPGTYTLVCYPHDRWSPNWGGETLFYDHSESTVVGCAYPRPNGGVLFDGRIPHRAAGVSRIFTGMRITLMFKVEDVGGQPPLHIPH